MYKLLERSLCEAKIISETGDIGTVCNSIALISQGKLTTLSMYVRKGNNTGFGLEISLAKVQKKQKNSCAITTL